MTAAFGSAPFPFSGLARATFDLGDLVFELINRLSDVSYVVRKLPFCAMVSEQFDFAEGDFCA